MKNQIGVQPHACRGDFNDAAGNGGIHGRSSIAFSKSR